MSFDVVGLLPGASDEAVRVAEMPAFSRSAVDDAMSSLAETFLAGHVRDKLATARVPAAEDPERYGSAVEEVCAPLRGTDSVLCLDGLLGTASRDGIVWFRSSAGSA